MGIKGGGGGWKDLGRKLIFLNRKFRGKMAVLGL